MMIGTGCDLVPIARIADTLEKQGDRFIDRCFAPSEKAYIEGRVEALPSERAAEIRAAGYAKRWAAKEACAKALGLGIREEIYLRDIVIGRDSAGKPTILLQGGAAERLAALTPAGMTAAVDVSLSDDGGLALAFVVISAHSDNQITPATADSYT